VNALVVFDLSNGLFGFLAARVEAKFDLNQEMHGLVNRRSASARQKNTLAPNRKADYVVFGWVVRKCPRKAIAQNGRAADWSPR